MDYITKSGSLEMAAIAMAEDIRTAIQTQTLTVSEKAQLMGVLTEIVGSAELAAEFVEMASTDIGATAQAYVDSKKGVGDNVNSDVSLKDSLQLDGYVILESKPAEVANAEWKNRGYDKPPIKPGTEVHIVEAGDNQYVRFYNVDENGKGNMIGRWLVKLSDIEGLTLSEIVDKYALPEPPEYMCDVNLPENSILEVSEANGLDGWGEGGGVQYDTMDGNLEADWFANPRKVN